RRAESPRLGAGSGRSRLHDSSGSAGYRQESLVLAVLVGRDEHDSSRKLIAERSCPATMPLLRRCGVLFTSLLRSSGQPRRWGVPLADLILELQPRQLLQFHDLYLALLRVESCPVLWDVVIGFGRLLSGEAEAVVVDLEGMGNEFHCH